jgi:hypothetical protein
MKSFSEVRLRVQPGSFCPAKPGLLIPRGQISGSTDPN